MENEIKLQAVGLIYNQSVVSTYSLVMREENGNRRFSILIGEAEAQSIALKMNNRTLARPLTHDLIKNIIETLQAKISKILIYDLVDTVFYSEIYIETKEDKVFVVEARTSDAVALAVRADCPIYIKKEILEIVGTEVETPVSTEKKQYTLNELDELTNEEINALSHEEQEAFLTQAVNEERYELAVKLRNALDLKKNKS